MIIRMAPIPHDIPFKEFEKPGCFDNIRCFIRKGEYVEKGSVYILTRPSKDDDEIPVERGIFLIVKEEIYINADPYEKGWAIYKPSVAKLIGTQEMTASGWEDQVRVLALMSQEIRWKVIDSSLKKMDELESDAGA